jgi:O-6-methylguanine DNA methyltransferase
MIREKVFKIVSKVPIGKVTTYKSVAEKAGTGPRAVGKIMNTNPDTKRVPCHRVIMSDGSIGGYATGVEKKIKLLRSEGVEIKNGKIDLKRFLYG